jgi:hypothetical protein
MTKEVKEVSTLKFSKQQQSFIAGLKGEDLKEFNALEDADKIELLELQLGIDSDALSLDGKVELEKTGFKTDGINILVLGAEGIRGLVAGRKVTAMFMGISYIFSDKSIENWTEVVTADGKEKKWRSEYARFRKTNGVEFGIFTCPMMRNALRTLVTNSSSPKLTAKDPIVTIEYFGKVSKDVASKDFDFVMTTGSETHAVIVRKEKGALENLNRGIHNYLVSPTPTSKVDTDDMTRGEMEALSYSNQVRANEEAGARQAQISNGLLNENNIAQ